MARFDMGGVLVDDDYWDCECTEDYIHPASEAVCPRCGLSREDGPPSHVEEICRLKIKEK